MKHDIKTYIKKPKYTNPIKYIKEYNVIDVNQKNMKITKYDNKYFSKDIYNCFGIILFFLSKISDVVNITNIWEIYIVIDTNNPKNKYVNVTIIFIYIFYEGLKLLYFF